MALSWISDALLEIVSPAMPTMRAFTFIETGMLIAALLVEQLIGNDLRRQLFRRQAWR